MLYTRVLQQVYVMPDLPGRRGDGAGLPGVRMAGSLLYAAHKAAARPEDGRDPDEEKIEGRSG